MKHPILYILFAIIFVACNKNNEQYTYPVLHVNLDETNTPSLFDIFKKIEIIPLETSDSCLITTVSKIEVYNNLYYIFDQTTHSLFCFDAQGKFVNKTGTSGQGPEDYANAADFLINPYKNVVEILSPFGVIYSYDLYGHFVGKTESMLSNEMANVQRIFLFNDSIRLLYGFTDNNKNQLHTFSMQSNQIVNSFYSEKTALFMFSNQVFYRYNDAAYFYKPFINTVFTIHPPKYKIAYAWDFGEMNQNANQFENFKDMQATIELFKNSKLKAICDIQYQNDKYYYTRILRNFDHTTHVFHSKNNADKFVFEKFKEDLFFFPIYWCEDYVLATSSTYGKQAVHYSVLDEDAARKLKSIKDDDNPFIIKYHFGKNK